MWVILARSKGVVIGQGYEFRIWPVINSGAA